MLRRRLVLRRVVGWRLLVHRSGLLAHWLLYLELLVVLNVLAVVRFLALDLGLRSWLLVRHMGFKFDRVLLVVLLNLVVLVYMGQRVVLNAHTLVVVLLGPVLAQNHERVRNTVVRMSHLQLWLGYLLLPVLLLMQKSLKRFRMARLQLKNLLESNISFFRLIALVIQDSQVEPDLRHVWLESRSLDNSLKGFSVFSLQV